VSFCKTHNSRVYTDEGKVLREWGKRGKGDGEFEQPAGMVFTPEGSVYVADQGNHRVQKFDAEGKFLLTWGSHGNMAGQFGAPEAAGSRFGGPHFLARDSKGNIFTTEGVPGRVQQFSADGKSLQAWGNKTAQPGGFGSLGTPYSSHTFGPIGACVDKQDRVWVSSLNMRVQRFSAEGKYLMGIGGKGNEPGQFNYPHAMAVDSKGHLYVVDSENR